MGDDRGAMHDMADPMSGSDAGGDMGGAGPSSLDDGRDATDGLEELDDDGMTDEEMDEALRDRGGTGG
ncbi:hypothetical protein [Sphingomonas lenta]|uniref:Uncharacterized protein n=1 Tax=Sphingomonas lenta TaxID=1141887 RepID=A0A2A2SBL0_9SPHN|nr:hypothetical protein [Sphingomonas lenta]PAX06585.1 hypothetical protein CKY28_15650 [Sphingomonas lenta]